MTSCTVEPDAARGHCRPATDGRVSRALIADLAAQAGKRPSASQCGKKLCTTRPLTNLVRGQ